MTLNLPLFGHNNRSHSDGFSVAASPSLQSHACCGRYALISNHKNIGDKNGF